MASITLTVSAAQAARIAAALAPTDYEESLAGCKEMIRDYLKDFVTSFERVKSQKTALAAVTEPAEVTIT